MGVNSSESEFVSRYSGVRDCELSEASRQSGSILQAEFQVGIKPGQTVVSADCITVYLPENQEEISGGIVVR